MLYWRKPPQKETQDVTMNDTPTQLHDSSQQSARNLLIPKSDTAYTPGLEEAPAIDTSLDSPSFVHENLQNESDLGEIPLGGVG